jgi:ABC-type glycerol-3-phosphate transport system substrate-binding protein
MRFSKVRNLMVMFLAIMVVLLVIGCSSKKESSPSASSSSSASPSASAPASETPTPSASSDSGPDLQGATIKFGSWFDMDPRAIAEKDRGPGDDISIQLIKDAEKKYNCKIEFVKFGDYNKYVENFTTTALSGEPFADVAALELFNAFPKMVKQGFIIPINDMIDLSDATAYTTWMKTGGSFEGQQYGFYDGTPSPYGLIYNKTLVQKLGLEDPYELQKNGQWTWEKFRDFMKKATKDTNGDGKTDVWGLTGGWDGLTRITEQFVYDNNGAVDHDQSGNIKFSLNSQNAIDGLQFVSDLYNVDKSMEQPYPQDPFKDFVAQKGVMVAGFSWNIGDLLKNMPDQQLGLVFFPKAPQNSSYVTYTPYGNMFFAVKQSKHADIAMKIFDEISLKSKTRELSVEGWKSSFPSADMVDTRGQMYDSVQYSGGYMAIPDGGKLFDSVVKDITDGKVAPATAVDKVKGQFEGKIQDLLAGK